MSPKKGSDNIDGWAASSSHMTTSSFAPCHSQARHRFSPPLLSLQRQHTVQTLFAKDYKLLFVAFSLPLLYSLFTTLRHNHPYNSFPAGTPGKFFCDSHQKQIGCGSQQIRGELPCPRRRSPHSSHHRDCVLFLLFFLHPYYSVSIILHRQG